MTNNDNDNRNDDNDNKESNNEDDVILLIIMITTIIIMMMMMMVVITIMETIIKSSNNDNNNNNNNSNPVLWPPVLQRLSTACNFYYAYAIAHISKHLFWELLRPTTDLINYQNILPDIHDKTFQYCGPYPQISGPPLILCEVFITYMKFRTTVVMVIYHLSRLAIM